MESKSREYISSFKPKLERLDSATDAELSLFHAGEGYENFDHFISAKMENGKTEAEDCEENGNGATHLIWDMAGKERKLVAYFTLSASVIPYSDGIEEDESEEKDLFQKLSNFPYIPVLEIKMFAVDEFYQDKFYTYKELSMPVSAWCLRTLVGLADFLSTKMIGFQGLFLHAVPNAVNFYSTNGFSEMPKAARPLYSIDQDFTAMWMAMRKVFIPLEEE